MPPSSKKNDATYQVDTQHGKRTKVKANNVFAEFDGDMAAFLENAQAQAADIDTDLLWEVCGEEEFTAEAIAEEYFGHAPTKNRAGGNFDCAVRRADVFL